MSKEDIIKSHSPLETKSDPSTLGGWKNQEHTYDPSPIEEGKGVDEVTNIHEAFLVNSKTKSYGVRKSEILAKYYTGYFRKIFLFFGIFLVAYAYGLDGSLRYNFTTFAANSYSQHSLYATIGVIRAVIAAAAQPTFARLSDYFGRAELFIFSIIFYIVGTIIQSQAYDIQRFAGGSVLYQVGYTGVILLLQLFCADYSTLNWRLVASFIPALPFIINTWIAGDALVALQNNHSWQYSIGIWAFIFPLCCVPLLISLFDMKRVVKNTDEWYQFQKEETDYQRLGFFKFLVFLFWKLDLVGVLFVICVFGFILTPFTLAGGVTEKWKQGGIIVPLVIGFVLIPFFVLWENKYAKHPIAPFYLLKDRGVYGALIIGIMIDWVWYMPNDFIFTVLIVSMHASEKAANRISSLYSFVSVITGPLLGLAVVKVKRLKGFIIFGVVCWFISNGLLVYYRGGSESIKGVIGALCLYGFGAGFFTYPTQVLIQACTNHENLGVITGLYLASYNIGAAFGQAVSGAVWQNTLFKQLSLELGNVTLATTAYGAPLTFIKTYTWGTPEREAVVEAYKYTQKILCIVGLCLCVPVLFATFLLRDHKLGKVQSLEFEQGSEKEHALYDNDDDVILNLFRKLFKRNKV